MVKLFTIYKDEEIILQEIASGNSKGLNWVYKTCFDTTKKMVLKLGGDEDEAWDIFQDAVTILYDKCSSAEGVELNCRIRTYITAIAKNLWSKRFKQKIATVLPEEWDEAVDTGAEDLQNFLQKEDDLRKLHNALEKLGSPCNELLQSFYFSKKSMQEIAAIFGYTNTDNAKTQKYKCLNRLKKLFLDLK
jgi:RNA polymerase sigma factor (sigma-70 family)